MVHKFFSLDLEALRHTVNVLGIGLSVDMLTVRVNDVLFTSSEKGDSASSSTRVVDARGISPDCYVEKKLEI